MCSRCESYWKPVGSEVDKPEHMMEITRKLAGDIMNFLLQDDSYEAELLLRKMTIAYFGEEAFL